jgi:type I restriction enzyme, S subunit
VRVSPMISPTLLARISGPEMTIFAHRIGPDKLKPRLDASFYAPEHLARDQRLAALGIPRKLLGAFSILITDGTHQTPEYVSEDGKMFLSATNLNPGWIDCSEHKLVSDRSFQYLLKSNCVPQEGDVLIAKSGSIGNCAVVTKNTREFGIFESVAIVRQTEADPYYLSSVINSTHGHSELIRQMKGVVIRHLHLEDLREFEPVFPDMVIQRYIGAKVRQADRLRTQAVQLECDFRTHIASQCPDLAKSPTTRRSAAIAPASLGRNLNPGAYWPDRLAVRAHLKIHGAQELSSFADIESETGNSGVDDKPYFGLDAFDSQSCRLSPSSVRDAEIDGTVRILPEGPVISRLRPYLNKVGYIPSTFAGSLGSTELLCVRPKAGVDGRYLYGVLKLDSSLRQLNPLANGSTLPRIDREDVLELLVPVHPQSTTLGNLLKSAQSHYFSSEALIQAAKLLVEALIEGKVTEADLITAANDPAADRALLARLTRSGLDAAGAAPLFPDAAALDSLVTDAHTQHGTP